jgi:hypothetical protein
VTVGTARRPTTMSTTIAMTTKKHLKDVLRDHRELPDHRE